MDASTCLNCGANLDLSSNTKYVKCGYCGTVVANYTPFERIETITAAQCASSSASDGIGDEGSVKMMVVAFRMKDYAELLRCAESTLKKAPDSWIARTYCAIAQFWLGTDDFTHLPKIVKTVSIARELSRDNEFVLQACESIAHDMIVLAAKNEPHGEQLEGAIRAIRTSALIYPSSPESSVILSGYCARVHQFYSQYFDDLIKKNKKDYDPPGSSIARLGELAIATENLALLEAFYLHGHVHLPKSSTKSYHADLKQELTRTEELLRKKGSQLVGKRITFGMFGSMSIK